MHLDFDSIPKNDEISLLISGGVDSSVALGLLKNAGFQIKAYYLKIWLEDELTHLGDCPWEEDLKFARSVCEKYQVPLEVIPLQREYEKKVIQYTLQELKSGGTPSPDLFCNSLIKFGAFAEKSQSRWIATGHYARVIHSFDNEKVQSSKLCKAVDPIKDQTYFLSQLSQEQLKKVVFPLGSLDKQNVRELANSWNLPNASRKDSQGICFLGKIPYRTFVKHHLGEKSGAIVHRKTGKEVGIHDGSWFHTIGQRKGLGLSGGPWFVVEKDFEKNIIFVEHEPDALGTKPAGKRFQLAACTQKRVF
jgi:tRNA-specific 2-thiouridylase